MAQEEKPNPIQTQSEEEGGMRPGNGDIRVLLVGINDYKDERVKDLGGCISDINRVESFLKNRFGIEPSTPASNTGSDPIKEFKTYPIPHDGYNQLMICRLEDGQATYANIVQAFHDFLKPAGVNDRVWFHFSGHGTQSPTAEEFFNLEGGEDQCLVCHDFTVDAETKEIKNLLADKELAVLLNEVASGDGGTPHMVITLDCCHSGGATRDATISDHNFKSRHTVVDASGLRLLGSYLNGHYTELVKRGGHLEAPASAHVVMTACNNLQLAGELGGGFFTAGLIDALESVGGKISYADLQVRTRAAVRKKGRDQTPQFDVLGGAKAYTRFLEGTPEGDPDKYEVKFQNGAWTVACGAIQGMSTQAMQKMATSGNQPILLEVFSFESADKEKPAAIAKILEVGPQYSTIGPLEEGGELGLNARGSYYGMLNYFPAEPSFVKITGTPDAVQAFKDNWANYSKIGAKNIHFATEPDPDKPQDLEVVIGPDSYRIKDRQTGKFADAEYGLATPNEVLIDLIQIVNWRRLRDLENTDPKSNLKVRIDQEDGSFQLKDKITLKIDFEGKGDIVVEPQPEDQGNTLVLKATKTNSISNDHPNERYFHLTPKITIEGKTEPLYFYLFKLWSWYGITADEEKKSEGVAADKTKLLEFQRFRWGIAEEEESDTAYFKLVATSEELDYHQLLQDGVWDGRGRPKLEFKPEASGFKDWAVATLKVTIVRES